MFQKKILKLSLFKIILQLHIITNYISVLDKMFGRRPNPSRKSEDIKKSAAKVLDAKKDTPTRARHLRLFLDNAENPEILLFFENHYSHVFFIVYDAFIGAEINLRQKGKENMYIYLN